MSSLNFLKLRKVLYCVKGRIKIYLISKRKVNSKIKKIKKFPNNVKIITLHYWDTREKFSQSWKYNAFLVKHNFLILHKNLPKNYFVENHIFLHKVIEIPSVYRLVDKLKQKYNILLHLFEMDLSCINHFHKFNYVAKKSYEILKDVILNFDYVFTIGQDNFLVNHFDENIFSIFIKLFNKTAFNEKLGHYKKEKYDYISHTISENPDWKYFQHNASVQKGFYKINKYPYILESVSNSKNLMTAESYLGQGLGQKCLYLRPNKYLYYSEYQMEGLNKEKIKIILKIANNIKKTKEMIEKIKSHRYASIELFLNEYV